MGKLAKNIIDFCDTLAPYSYVLAVVGILAIGVLYAIPSEKTHEAAKKFGPGVVIGTLLIAGCVTLGKWIGNSWTF